MSPATSAVTSAPFRLLTHGRAGRPVGAVAVGELAYDLSEARPATPTVLAVLEDWDAASADLGALAASPARLAALTGTPLASLDYRAPVLYPNGIYCAGANYRDHLEEMSRLMGMPMPPDPHETGTPPWCFIKTPRGSLVGHGATVKLPAFSKKVDWEIEVALVIGRTCKDVSEAEALDYVAGYSIANDLSARDLMRRPTVAPGSGSPFEFDWLSHKTWDGSCPMGPWIVPRQHLAAAADPASLGMRLWVNDTLMQDSSTRNLIFKEAELVSFLSHRLTLHPGDVILTGTPAGVGTPRGLFLQPGDVVRLEVEGIGTLVHRMA